MEQHFKILKKEGHPRNLYPAKIYLKKKVKYIFRPQKLKEYIDSKSELQNMLKGSSSALRKTIPY